MRLPRNVKIFRGQLDVAPFAGVTFLLLLFVLLQSKLVFTPGIHVELPAVSRDMPGADGPSVLVAVDKSGQIYYENQAVPSLADLRGRLRAAVQNSKEPLLLEIMADKTATLETTAQLLALAGEVGMSGALLVTRPPLEPVMVRAR